MQQLLNFTGRVLTTQSCACTQSHFIFAYFRPQSCDQPPPKTVNYHLSLFLLAEVLTSSICISCSTSVFLHSEFLELVFFILPVLTFVWCNIYFCSASSSVSLIKSDNSAEAELALIIREENVGFQIIFILIFKLVSQS